MSAPSGLLADETAVLTTKVTSSFSVIDPPEGYTLIVWADPITRPCRVYWDTPEFSRRVSQAAVPPEDRLPFRALGTR